MQRISLLAGVLLLLSGPALAFNPCLGPRQDARTGTSNSLLYQANAQAVSEALTPGTAAFMARVQALLAAPTEAMTNAAATAQTAANTAKTTCESAAGP